MMMRKMPLKAAQDVGTFCSRRKSPVFPHTRPPHIAPASSVKGFAAFLVLHMSPAPSALGFGRLRTSTTMHHMGPAPAPCDATWCPEPAWRP